MKTLKLTAIALLIALTYNCKEFKKGYDEGMKEAEAEAAKEIEAENNEVVYQVIADSVKVGFKAYKTTEKLPVGGSFTEVNLKNSVSGKSPVLALNGLEFGIPVSSLFTNDATGTRDPKIKEFFFGVMKNTELISGSFAVSGESLSLKLNLNGESKSLPMTFEKVTDNHYKISGNMELGDWNGLEALASLNKACEALHTGADGVSKTWSDVAIHADVFIPQK